MRLFVAVLCHAEFGHVNVWQSSVLPYHAKILHSGEARVKFFTYNEKMKVELESHGLEAVYGPRDLDVETPYPPRIYVDDPREFNASFWRDYQIAVFRYALANHDFRIFVKGEIDSVFCIETLARASTALGAALGGASDLVLGWKRGCGFDDNFLLSTRGALADVVAHWRPRLRLEALRIAGAAASASGHWRGGHPNLGPILPRLVATARQWNLTRAAALPANDDVDLEQLQPIYHGPTIHHLARRQERRFESFCRRFFYAHKAKQVNVLKAAFPREVNASEAPLSVGDWEAGFWRRRPGLACDGCTSVVRRKKGDRTAWRFEAWPGPWVCDRPS